HSDRFGKNHGRTEPCEKKRNHRWQNHERWGRLFLPAKSLPNMILSGHDSVICSIGALFRSAFFAPLLFPIFLSAIFLSLSSGQLFGCVLPLCVSPRLSAASALKSG